MRRPFRKWQMALLAGAVAGTLAVCLLIYIQRSYWIDRHLPSWIISYLEANYPVRVTIDAADFNLEKRHLILRGVRITGEQFPQSPPPVEIGEIELHFSYRVWNLLFRLDEALIRNPTVRVVEDPNGALNLANMFQPRSSEKRQTQFRLQQVPRIAVQNGLISFLGRTLALETEAADLSASVSESAGSPTYHAEFAASRLHIGKPGQEFRNLKLNGEFRADGGAATILSLSAESDVAKLNSVQGSVRFRPLAFDLNGNFQADLGLLQVAAVRSAGARGQVTFKGAVRGNEGKFSAEGTVASEALQILQYRFSDVTASVNSAPDRIVMDRVRGRTLGGNFQARLALGLDQKQLSEAEGSIARASMQEALQTLSIPLSNLAGQVDADFRVRWPGFQITAAAGTTELRYSGKILPTPAVRLAFPDSAVESVPYQGSLTATIAGTEFLVQNGSLSAGNSRAQFSGSLTAAGRYNMKVRLSAAQGSELLHVAGLFSDTARREIRQRGLSTSAPVSFDGEITGTRTDFRIAGRATASEVRLRQVTLTGLDTRLEWTPRLLLLDRASLRFGTSSMEGTVRIPLSVPGQPVSVDAAVRQMALSDLMAVAGWNLPVQGTLSGTIQARGPNLDSVEGQAQLTLDRSVVWGQPVSRMSASVGFKGRQYSVSNLEAATAGGTITGSVRGTAGEKTAEVDLSGRNLSLADIKLPAVAPYGLTGRLNFTLKGSGGLERLHHDLRANVSDFRIRGESLQSVQVQARGEGQEVVFDASASFQSSRVQARGKVGTTGDFPFEAGIDLRNAPLRPYLALFHTGISPSAAGLATGRIEARGNLRHVDQAAATGTFRALQLVSGRYQLHNEGDVTLRYASGVLTINPAKMVGPDTQLNISGRATVKNRGPLNLTVTGTADLLALAGFMPELNASGKAQVNVVAAGTVEKPQIIGSATFEKASFTHTDWPTPLLDVSGALRFTASQVAVQGITARTRYGTVRVEGGMFLDGFRPARGRLNITGEGLRFEYPEDVRSTIDIDMDFLKSATGQLVSGVVYVRNSEYTRDLALADLVTELSKYRDLSSGPAVGRAEVNLDLDVEAYRTIRITNNLADIVCSGVFNVRGTVTEPIILGRLAVDQGQLILQDSKYEIVRGGVNFNNPRRNIPTLDFEAETSVRDYTVTVNLRGPLDRLTTSFRSDPPLTTTDIITMLAVGRPVQQLSARSRDQQQRNQTLAFHGASTIISRGLMEKLTGRSTRLFGFDRFTVDPFILAGTNPGARVTLGKQISKNLSLIFATDLASTQSEVVSIEYSIRGGMTLVATRTETGAFGLDIKFRKRF